MTDPPKPPEAELHALAERARELERAIAVKERRLLRLQGRPESSRSRITGMTPVVVERALPPLALPEARHALLLALHRELGGAGVSRREGGAFHWHAALGQLQQSGLRVSLTPRPEGALLRLRDEGLFQQRDFLLGTIFFGSLLVMLLTAHFVLEGALLPTMALSLVGVVAVVGGGLLAARRRARRSLDALAERLAAALSRVLSDGPRARVDEDAGRLEEVDRQEEIEPEEVELEGEPERAGEPAPPEEEARDVP